MCAVQAVSILMAPARNRQREPAARQPADSITVCDWPWSSLATVTEQTLMAARTPAAQPKTQVTTPRETSTA